MSRSYAPTELKRRLKPALEELEQLGFLEPLSPEERYSYVKRGTLADHPDPGPQRHGGVTTRRRRARARRAGRGSEGARGHGQDRRGAGRDPPGQPDPDQDRGLRLADAERGQAGRQEPRRLPRRLDPVRLPGPGDYQLPSQQGPARPGTGQACQHRGSAKGQAEVQDQRDKAREAKLRAAWEQLPRPNARRSSPPSRPRTPA